MPTSRTTERIQDTDDLEGCLWDRACNLFTIWLWLLDDVECGREGINNAPFCIN